MRIFAGALAVTLVTVSAPASAMDVQSFLVRVQSLQKRGPLALLSRDFYRLKRLVEADGQSLKADYARDMAAHRRTNFCPPEKGKPRVGKKEYLAALKAVPVAARSSTDTKDVLRGVLERKYPCGGQPGVQRSP